MIKLNTIMIKLKPEMHISMLRKNEYNPLKLHLSNPGYIIPVNRANGRPWSSEFHLCRMIPAGCYFIHPSRSPFRQRSRCLFVLYATFAEKTTSCAGLVEKEGVLSIYCVRKQRVSSCSPSYVWGQRSGTLPSFNCIILEFNIVIWEKNDYIEFFLICIVLLRLI